MSEATQKAPISLRKSPGLQLRIQKGNWSYPSKASILSTLFAPVHDKDKKNRKYGITNLYDIPELLKVVQEWDDEIRAILPANGLWFAPLSPETGKIDPSVVSIGEHRATLARRSIKEFIDSKGYPYHSPHKFRHGHIQYGLAHSESIADYKAVSMKITDQFYSNLNDGEVQTRISGLKEKTNLQMIVN